METGKNMKTTAAMLKTAAALYAAAAAGIAIIYETGVLESGTEVGNSAFEYVLLTTMELLTLCCIPLALKLVSIERAKRLAGSDTHKAYRRLALLRLSLLGMAMVANTLFYYMSLSVAFLYLAILTALCFAFVYPSDSRYLNEMEKWK